MYEAAGRWRKNNLHLYSLLEGIDIVNGSGDVDGEIDAVHHLGASPEIAYRLREEDGVRIVYLLHVVPQKYCRQDVHLFYYHLCFSDLTKVKNTYKMLLHFSLFFTKVRSTTVCLSGYDQLLTWMSSMTQRSPTSKGCITKTKTMDSKMVLQVFWNIKPTRRSWDVTTNITFVVAKRDTTIMITITTALASLCNCWTAVLVSFKECASAFLSKYACTCPCPKCTHARVDDVTTRTN